MSIPETVLDYIQHRGVDFHLIDHPYAPTSKTLSELSHVDRGHIAKGVLLGDEDGPLLVVVPGDHWVRLHHVQEVSGRPGLSFAGEEDILRHFPDCDPGAVPPLGLAYGIPTYLDEDLTTLAKVYMEAGDHRHLIEVTGTDFLRLMAGACRGHFSHED